MKNKKTVILLLVFLLLGLAAAANNTNTSNSSFVIENSDIESNVSVNQFGQNIGNITSKYWDNSTQSRTFNVQVNGNVSQILDSPSVFTLFQNQSSSFPLVANVPKDQRFGHYNGSLVMESQGNSSFRDSVNVSVNVFDDVKPSFTSTSVSSVQSTESVDWSVSVEDNLNVSSVGGKVLFETTEVQGNNTVQVNKTVDSFEFNRDSGSEWSYTFSDTDKIGQYFLELNASDESGNTVNRTEIFEVEGLDSITVLDDNFVFDTIQAKDQANYELVSSSIEGKEFTVTLENLSYGGNETVRIGVLPPNGDSPEILDQGETRSFSEEGGYELVLIHSGNDELKGTHRVTGELFVSKPENHVEPVNSTVVFSGTVKNLDKPPEKCERVKEFDSCIAYSLDQAQSMFDEEYNISDEESRDYAYLIGRIPTTSVEGSEEWGRQTSLTFGEYNKTIKENKELETEVNRKIEPYWKNLAILILVISGISLGFIYFIYPTFEFDRKKFREKNIRKMQTDKEKSFGFLERWKN